MHAPSQRKIIHCDCDSFYVSVEVRDNPALQGLPVAVGGRAEQRGVIATCSYEARRFGVHSALPTSQALRLCPSLILLPPDFPRYRETSRQILNIYREYTDLVEPLSLDEAFLDVSGQPHCQGSATLMAEEIRSRIHTEAGITASAGIAPNKFLAKVASDWNKPNGQFLVTPDQADAFTAALPVERIFGVGKVTRAKLHKMGVTHCGQLRQWSQTELRLQFGSFGENLYLLCRGIDERPVVANRIRKSLSVEITFAHDLPDLPACLSALSALEEDFQLRLQRHSDHPPMAAAAVKIKFSDFSQTTAECRASDTNTLLWRQLIEEAYLRKAMPVRLLGIGVRFKADTAPDTADKQLNLFPE